MSRSATKEEDGSSRVDALKEDRNAGLSVYEGRISRTLCCLLSNRPRCLPAVEVSLDVNKICCSLADEDAILVLSFMSSFSSKDRDAQRSPTPTGAAPIQTGQESFPRYDAARDPITPARGQPLYNMDGESPQQPRVQRERAPSRPMSMVQTYQPPLMDVNQDTLPELQPIFTFLNSHANKLYQEGYFLKLDDQNTRMFLQDLRLCRSNRIYRWKTQCRQNLDGMFRATGWNRALIMGCGRARCCWSRWGGAAQIHQFDRCLN